MLWGEAESQLSAIPDASEPRPWGAVTRGAVAQRRSRAGGLTRPLAEAIRGFDSGFGLGFVVGSACPFRCGMVSKSFVFSSLPIRKVLVLPFPGGALAPLFGWFLFLPASYPQDRRSYYLFFNYLFFNYLYRCPVCSKN